MADPIASVVVTVRGEPPERLAQLLLSLGAQDVDGELELILAVDRRQDPELGDLAPTGALTRIVVVDNPGGARSTGLNRAVAAAASSFICRLDARSRPAPDHMRRCLARLKADTTVGIVGGGQRPRPAGCSPTARGIALALSNPWLLGGAAYRRSGRSGSVDTVYLGAFRRSELVELGGYDERLAANEDFDLAQRYRRSGRLVWLEEGLEVEYEARAAIKDVFKQYFAFGRSKVGYWRLRSERPNARQIAALGAAVSTSSLVAASATRPRRLVGILLGGAAALAVLDHLAHPQRSDVAVRLSSIIASGAVLSGWLAGVAVEVLAPAERGDDDGDNRLPS